VEPLIDRHGGDVYQAARQQGCDPSEILDFSASINPIGPSLSVSRVLRDALGPIRNYPDPLAHDLVSALSRRSGIPPSNYLVGNGSVELLYLIPGALRIKNAIVIGPTFSEYQKAIKLAGGSSRYIMAERPTAYRPPIEAVLHDVERADPRPDAVVVCNPNSPTGQAVATQELLRFVYAMAGRDVWVIVDESFIEFAPEFSVLPASPAYRHLLVVRSFSKFYGMPGLRIGYVVAHPDIVEQLKQYQPPWSVNALAQRAALAALKDGGHRRKSLALIAEERTRVTAALQAMEGLRVYPSVVNFLLLDLPIALYASDIAARLRDSGLLIRDCSTIPGLTPQSIRIAIRSSRENDRLLRAIESILGRS
jgi:threonine-phosphate decarboxylase